MSTVSTTQSTAASVLANINTREKAAATSSEDMNARFLTLLTTQLKNQDPLNPLDNAEVTSQLAQISTVSGIEKLNATLQTLLDGMSVSQTTLTANLVGRQRRRSDGHHQGRQRPRG